MDYSNYIGPGGEREQAMRNLADYSRKEQEFANSQYRKAEAARKKQLAEMKAEEKESQRGWLQESATGAQIGMTAGGPWGALAGGLAGAALGQVKDAQSRKKEEGGFWKAFLKSQYKPMGDKVEARDVPWQQAASIAGGMAGGFGKTGAAKSVGAANGGMQGAQAAKYGEAGYNAVRPGPQMPQGAAMSGPAPAASTYSAPSIQQRPTVMSTGPMYQPYASPQVGPPSSAPVNYSYSGRSLAQPAAPAALPGFGSSMAGSQVAPQQAPPEMWLAQQRGLQPTNEPGVFAGPDGNFYAADPFNPGSFARI